MLETKLLLTSISTFGARRISIYLWL